MSSAAVHVLWQVPVDFVQYIRQHYYNHSTSDVYQNNNITPINVKATKESNKLKLKQELP